MQKVAVFGNAGGGKSTLSRRLAELTGLPLYVLDKIQYLPGGIAITPEDYLRRHGEILATDQWIMDGFGSIETLWPRLNAADTLVYIDLPLPVHYWFVTKRLITGYFQPPAGWPENSPIWASSLNSYRVIQKCDQYLTPRYREYVQQMQDMKTVYHLQSTQQIAALLELMTHQLNANSV